MDEVDAAIERKVPLWKFSRFLWASFFWSQFFPSIFPLPWCIKWFLIAHTYFSVINNGFLIKVIICYPARSTVLTNTASETDVCLGKLRREGSIEFGEGWVGTEWWSGFSIEICGLLLMVYSTQTKAKMHHFQREAGEKAPNQSNLGASPSLAWMQREPGAWWTGAANAHTSQPPSVWKMAAILVGSVVSAEKALNFSRHRCSHWWNVTLKWMYRQLLPQAELGGVKSQTGWRMVYVWEENTRRFVQEIFAGDWIPHSSMLQLWSKPAPQWKVRWFCSSIASFAVLLEAKEVNKLF